MAHTGSGSPLLFRASPWTFTVDDDRLPLVAATSTFMYPCRYTAYPLRSLTRLRSCKPLASSLMLQASSYKLQATSYKLFKDSRFITKRRPQPNGITSISPHVFTQKNHSLPLSKRRALARHKRRALARYKRRAQRDINVEHSET